MAPPRYVPERSLPDHAFIPGLTPRPNSTDARPAGPLDQRRWHQNTEYLWGVDLYNHGYPWEAHEAWEGLWRMAGQNSPERAFLQGLIQCAAAVVKARGGQPVGMVKLGHSGLGLLQAVARDSGPRYMGVDLAAFMAAFHAYVLASPPVPDAWPIITISGNIDIDGDAVTPGA